MRLNKFLANSGVGSRRECDNLIQDNGVIINGKEIFTPSTQVEDGDEVVYNGKKIELISKLDAIILNKPLDYLTSLSDTHGRKVVYDILPKDYRNYKYAGRLDYNSTGLILLINKSDYAEMITNPKHKVEKVYEVICKYPILDEELEKLRNGVVLDDGMETKPAKINKIDKFKVQVIISEGKKRQVRRMFDAVGNRVEKLHRESIGNISVKDLKIGQYRTLAKEELEELFK